MSVLDLDLIETPENVELERRLAGIGSRFMAGVVDTLVLAGVYLLLVLAFLATVWADVWDPSAFFDGAGMWVLAALLLVFFTTYWGYFVFFEMYTNGQSPGKKALKIRVVKQGGGPITFLDVAVRNLLRAVDGLAGYGVAGIVMFITKKGQRLGDLAAGTVVVSEQRLDYSARSDKRTRARWEAEVRPEALRATGLKPEEYRVLLNYWTRRHELAFDARMRLLPKLVRPVLERTGQTLPNESLGVLEDYVYMLISQAAMAANQVPPPPPPKPEGPP